MPSPHVEREHIARMRELVARELGLELTDDADEALGAALSQRLAERKMTATRYLELLGEHDVKELHALGQLLTVGETYFFRMGGHSRPSARWATRAPRVP